ncbi:MAG TPA: NADH-quinone oxidoreductase subunit J [Gemmatimonadota bacterium]|nr:NADH-quinone oxidoreductase subunit J [Gemmatimonadota bacterium]
MTEFLFFLFSATAVLSAVLVITRRNPVSAVMFLIVTLFSLAGLFVLLEAHFLAAVQVIVYAGAIMVLFLFVVMLLNLGHAAAGDFRGAFARMLAGAFGLALAGFTAWMVMGGQAPVPGAGGARVADPILPLLEEHGAVGAVAVPLFHDYLVPFEVTSILLLVAIVGAIVLARKEAP